jgi:putative tryptophan/tyrosine transport system substrate-binding protein
MHRREFIAGLGSSAAWPLTARAQSVVPLVGRLGGAASTEDMGEPINWMKQGLAETGFVEGRNFAFEYCWANYHLELMPALAADLVRRRVSVIGTSLIAGANAAKAATQTIPIVFLTGIDPVAFGLVASFNRPGGNITGVAMFGSLLAAKRLELLRELLPNAGHFGVLVNPTGPTTASETNALRAAAGVLGVRLSIVNAAVPDEFEMAFATLVRQQVGALLIGDDALFFNRYEQLVALAARHALPTMYLERRAPRAGGLISYTADFVDAYDRVGGYMGRILKGEKPADLPVQQPTKVELIINKHEHREGARANVPLDPTRPRRRGDRVGSRLPLRHSVQVRSSDCWKRIASASACPPGADKPTRQAPVLHRPPSAAARLEAGIFRSRKPSAAMQKYIACPRARTTRTFQRRRRLCPVQGACERHDRCGYACGEQGLGKSDAADQGIRAARFKAG